MRVAKMNLSKAEVSMTVLSLKFLQSHFQNHHFLEQISKNLHQSGTKRSVHYFAQNVSVGLAAGTFLQIVQHKRTDVAVQRFHTEVRTHSSQRWKKRQEYCKKQSCVDVVYVLWHCLDPRYNG